MDIDKVFTHLRSLFQPAVANAHERLMWADRGAHAHVALREGYRLVPLPERRAPRPARKHAFQDAGSFCAFLLKAEHGFDPVKTEILGAMRASGGRIVAVSGPTWERDEVVFEMPRSAAWNHWMKRDGYNLNLKELRDLLRGRRADLNGKSRGVLADLTHVEVNVTKGGKVEIDPRTGLVVLDAVQKNTKVEGALPGEVELLIPVYEGGGEQLVTVDLIPSVADNGALFFQVRLVDPDKVIREAWLEQIRVVRETLGEAWQVGVGEMNFEVA